MRTDPPMSLPWAIGPMPVAMSAPAPPLEPPGETLGSRGFVSIGVVFRFVCDSLLEEAGFEPSVPPAGTDLFEVNGTKIRGVRERSSRFRQG